MTLPNAQTPPRADVSGVRRYRGYLMARADIPPNERTPADEAWLQQKDLSDDG